MLRVRRWLGRAAAGAVAAVVLGLFLLARLFPTRIVSAGGGALARAIGPRVKAGRIAAANIAAAFPERSAAEQRQIHLQAWDNLGRTAAEYPFLHRIWDYDPLRPERTGRIEVVGAEHFLALRDDGRPGLVFAAHLANWELLAVAGMRHGLDIAVLYREPNNPFVGWIIRRVRGRSMGRLIPTDLRGGLALVGVLRSGGHAGMLVDQHFSRGVPGHFLGRPVRTAPVIAKLGRAFDCPIHGARVVRLGGGRFRVELTPPLALPPPLADPHADEAAIMATVNRVIEGWVREHPGQWLWMHRRWREAPAAVIDKAGAGH